VDAWAERSDLTGTPTWAADNRVNLCLARRVPLPGLCLVSADMKFSPLTVS
jgi:hypothetical protein